MQVVCSIFSAQEPALRLREVNILELLSLCLCYSVHFDKHDLEAAQKELGRPHGMTVYLNAAERRSPSLLMVSMTARG